jgi:phosphoribosylamine---glycine ligase
MRILVVGGGGREHAIVRALRRSPSADELLCAPGNAGIAADARCLDLDPEDVPTIVDAAVAEDVELVAVGPEAPLVAGLVDALEAAGVPAFGPGAAAARLEGSKVHAKEVMAEAGVPTAGHVVLRDREAALEALAGTSYPAVLKADGLAAGKGVIIAGSGREAAEAVELFFVERRFGETEVVLEEHLDGEELSLLALCDGENVLPLAPAQDYKRIGDGDVGPNTGGMGSYSPVPGIGEADVEALADAVHRPVVELMRDRGTPFHGVLYAGLMMTASGPRVLEFNCRFGDPETQAVLPRLRTDLAELCLAAREPGGLGGKAADFDDRWAVTVVLASAGYPESSSKGDVITGLEEAAALEDVEITHAGTARRDGNVVTAGGRVLNVTALGADPAAARDRAYEAARLIGFDGIQMRTDIAARAVERTAVR